MQFWNEDFIIKGEKNNWLSPLLKQSWIVVFHTQTWFLQMKIFDVNKVIKYWIKIHETLTPYGAVCER